MNNDKPSISKSILHDDPAVDATDDASHQIYVVIPSWNGAAELPACLDSLRAQTLKPHVIIVDNGSVDDSVNIAKQHYPEAEFILHDHNKGYAGGVNPGFKLALERNVKYVAVFNNDAVADKAWLKELVTFLDSHDTYGAAACKLLSLDSSHLDTTGDYYTTWGLPYPRGRNETELDKYDQDTEIFAAGGGASLYRVAMLREIGLLDEDFFAYYEDVDLSFRAQLAGWKIAYVPTAKVYHALSVTGKRIKGFFTLQTMKNLPMLYWKNVPRGLLFKIGIRFALVYASFFVSATARGQLFYALQGWLRSLFFLPKKLSQRRHIQTHRKVDTAYIRSIIYWDLPPNATRLRKLRSAWWRLTGKNAKQQGAA